MWFTLKCRLKNSTAQRPKLSDGGHGRADGNRGAMLPFAAAHGLTAFSLEQNRPIAANSLITKRNQCLEYTLAINIVKAIVETLCTAPKLCCVLERALRLLCRQLSEPLADELKLSTKLGQLRRYPFTIAIGMRHQNRILLRSQLGCDDIAEISKIAVVPEHPTRNLLIAVENSEIKTHDLWLRITMPWPRANACNADEAEQSTVVMTNKCRRLCCAMNVARRNSYVSRNSEHALMRMTDSSFRASGKIPRARCVGECVIPSTGCPETDLELIKSQFKPRT